MKTLDLSSLAKKPDVTAPVEPAATPCGGAKSISTVACGSKPA
ncbi:MAG TPA: hypothetical protein VHG32_06350 [Thermoanaerobaculia bacterium]|jgi:hypothetical protein|nr:hypothetical protein [Thermoanaerobaculia bacterium]